MKTDKPKYYNRDHVQVFGNLTLDESLVTDGLVGLQIEDAQGKKMVLRTLSTGNPPPESPYVFIEYVAPCDSGGVPKFTFKKGTLAYFKTALYNYDIEPRYVLITINPYYGDSTPFGYAAIEATITAQSESIFIISIPVPTDAILGPAMVYANAYTDWPKLAGTPYCTEENATFEITATAYGSYQTPYTLTSQLSNETANYNTTFLLPRKVSHGNFTVYVTSRYFGESVFNSTTFQVFVIGDLGGGFPPQFFNFDNKVDSKDLALFLQCYKGTAPPEAMYLGDLGGGFPPQFFLFDGKVDSKDLALFLLAYKGLGP